MCVFWRLSESLQAQLIRLHDTGFWIAAFAPVWSAGTVLSNMHAVTDCNVCFYHWVNLALGGLLKISKKKKNNVCWCLVILQYRVRVRVLKEPQHHKLILNRTPVLILMTSRPWRTPDTELHDQSAVPVRHQEAAGERDGQAANFGRCQVAHHGRLQRRERRLENNGS